MPLSKPGSLKSRLQFIALSNGIGFAGIGQNNDFYLVVGQESADAEPRCRAANLPFWGCGSMIRFLNSRQWF